MKTLALLIAVFLTACATTYPVSVIDDTADMLVIRATGKTQYDALKSAKQEATSKLGQYVKAAEPDCNFNPSRGSQELYGTGIYEYAGSWHECVVYAQK